MNIARLAKSRTATVLGAAALVVVAGGTGAVAATQIHSRQIADNTILSKDIHDGTIRARDIHPNTVSAQRLTPWVRDQLTKQGLSTGDANWGVIDRNVIGNGAADLRVGPAGPGPDNAPPAGVGSLGLRTGSATDKAAFGDQVSFVGDPLSSMTNPSYYEYVTGEDLQTNPGNQVNLQLEINPHTNSSYSTLIFVPENLDPAQDGNKWTKVDASTAQRWYLTGAAGTSTGCDQATYCTLDEINQKLPDATVLSVQFSKGRDNAFSGAVDDLSIGGKSYDFEPTGVMD